MPPLRRSRSPMPYCRRLRERSSTVVRGWSVNFRRSKNEQLKQMEHRKHQLQQQLMNVRTTLDHAKGDNSLLIRLLESKDENLTIAHGCYKMLSRQLCEIQFDKQCVEDALKAERAKHCVVYNEIANTATHWHSRHCNQTSVIATVSSISERNPLPEVNHSLLRKFSMAEQALCDQGNNIIVGEQSQGTYEEDAHVSRLEAAGLTSNVTCEHGNEKKSDMDYNNQHENQALALMPEPIGLPIEYAPFQ